MVVGIVLVNYKTDGQTISYVRQELCKLTEQFKLVIVNNGSDEQSNQVLADGVGGVRVGSFEDCGPASADVFVLGSETNLGYAKGNNLGADFLCRHFDLQYLLITNNDIEISNPNTLSVLIAKMKQHPDIGVIGPSVVGPDGGAQSPYRFLSLWQLCIWKQLFYPFFWPWIRAGAFSDIVEGASEGYCYRVMGCFCLVRVAAFKRAGGFDPATFLYAEEQILAERLKSHGYRMYFTDAVKVVHHDGGTISEHLNRANRGIVAEQSLMHYYRTYIGVSWFDCMAFRLAQLLYWHVYRPPIDAVSRLLLRLRCRGRS